MLKVTEVFSNAKKTFETTLSTHFSSIWESVALASWQDVGLKMAVFTNSPKVCWAQMTGHCTDPDLIRVDCVQDFSGDSKAFFWQNGKHRV